MPSMTWPPPHTGWNSSSEGVATVGHEAFGVDLGALEKAETGVQDAIAELDEMASGDGIGGWIAGSAVAEQGGGLQSLDASVVGHEGLAEALSTFTERWNYAVRQMVDEGRAAAEALRDTRAFYQKMDDQAIDLLQRGLHSFLGDPSEDVTAWDDKTGGEIMREAGPNLGQQFGVDPYVELGLAEPEAPAGGER